MVKKYIRQTSKTTVIGPEKFISRFKSTVIYLAKKLKIDIVHEFKAPLRHQCFRSMTVNRLTNSTDLYKPMWEWRTNGRISLSTCGWSFELFTRAIIIAHELDRSLLDNNHVFVDNCGTVTLMKPQREQKVVMKIKELNSPAATMHL